MFQYFKEKFSWLVWSVGLLSISLISYQFLFRQGLGFDEMSIMDNLVQRNFLELLKPLGKWQVAPIMFLWVEKYLLIIADFFNQNWVDYFLRIYPVFCSLGVILLYYKLVLKLTNSKFISLIAYALLLFNPIFIYYSSEIKQYICELFYSILLIYVWLKKSETKWNIKNTAVFLLVVLLAIFNSSTICFILLPMGLYDGWKLIEKHELKIKNLIKDKETFYYTIRYSISLIFLGGYYLCFLYNHPSSQVMLNFWKDSFINSENILNVLNRSIQWFYPDFNILILGLGLLSLLVLKKKQVFILSFFILLGHIIFSCFKLYPVDTRLVFYWLVILPICFASLLYFVYDKCIIMDYSFLTKNEVLIIIFIISCIFCLEIRWKKLPIYLHDRYPKQSLEIIEKRYEEGDIIIFRSIQLPREYLSKYYIRTIPSDNIFDISETKWKVFLEKSMMRIDSLKESTRFWLVSNVQLNKNTLVNELEKNEEFNRLNMKISFCKELPKQVICLIKKVSQYQK